MSDNGNDGTKSSRRTLLKAVGAGALAGITIGAGNAAADGAEPMKILWNGDEM